MVYCFILIYTQFVKRVHLISQFKLYKSDINKYEKFKPLKPVFCAHSIDLMHIKRYNINVGHLTRF